MTRTGPDGWVSGRYLSDRGGFEPGPTAPDINLSFSISGFGFSFGDGGFDVAPPRPLSWGRVCFYEDANFQGARLCLSPGQSLRRLGAWNDRISSIDVSRGAEALVCVDARFAGRCVLVWHDIRNLGAGGNDRISSIRVR